MTEHDRGLSIDEQHDDETNVYEPDGSCDYEERPDEEAEAVAGPEKTTQHITSPNNTVSTANDILVLVDGEEISLESAEYTRTQEHGAYDAAFKGVGTDLAEVMNDPTDTYTITIENTHKGTVTTIPDAKPESVKVSTKADEVVTTTAHVWSDSISFDHHPTIQ